MFVAVLGFLLFSSGYLWLTSGLGPGTAYAKLLRIDEFATHGAPVLQPCRAT